LNWCFRFINLVRKRQMKLLSRFSWVVKFYLLGRLPNYVKRPQLPTLSCSEQDDVANFINWSSDMLFDNVGVFFRPSDSCLDIDVLGEKVEKNGKLLYQKSSSKSLLTFKFVATGKVFCVRFLADRSSYVAVLKEEQALKSSIDSQELKDILSTSKVDMLIICGADSVGNFPPLSLRACEIFFVDAPFAFLEFCACLQEYSKTEQRFGT